MQVCWYVLEGAGYEIARCFISIARREQSVALFERREQSRSERREREGAMAITTRAVFLALAVVTLSFLPTLAKDKDCVYTVYVRTGSIWRGGTDSTISVEFFDSEYTALLISNLTAWGGALMGQDRDYFARGALDIFSGLGDCLDYPICGLNLTSDGKGDGHGWYVNYVEVTTTGAHLPCGQHSFTVERWLASDTYPYSLTSEIDECSSTPSPRRRSSSQGGHLDLFSR